MIVFWILFSVILLIITFIQIEEDSLMENPCPIPDDIFQETSEGVIFTIEVSAAGKRDKFPEGYNPWRRSIGITVSAPPLEGKANKAIICLISKSLQIPQSNISIVSGHKSTVKRIKILGITPGIIQTYYLKNK
jgi:uncharacterized protein